MAEMEIWVGDEGAYAAGRLIDRPLQLPMAQDAMDKALESIREAARRAGSSGEELYISDVVRAPAGMEHIAHALAETGDIRAANVIAQMMADLPDACRKVDTVLEIADDRPDGVLGLANAIEEADDIPYFDYNLPWSEDVVRTMSPEEKYGEALLQNNEVGHALGELDVHMYFDAEAYGRDEAINNGATLGEDGYLEYQAHGPWPDAGLDWDDLAYEHVPERSPAEPAFPAPDEGRAETLSEMIDPDTERVAQLQIAGYEPRTFGVIVDADKPLDKQDIAACLEDTLHRLKDAGAGDTRILEAAGMVPGTDEARREMAEGGIEPVEVDLGYVLAGEPVSIRIPEDADAPAAPSHDGPVFAQLPGGEAAVFETRADLEGIWPEFAGGRVPDGGSVEPLADLAEDDMFRLEDGHVVYARLVEDDAAPGGLAWYYDEYAKAPVPGAAEEDWKALDGGALWGYPTAADLVADVYGPAEDIGYSEDMDDALCAGDARHEEARRAMDSKAGLHAGGPAARDAQVAAPKAGVVQEEAPAPEASRRTLK